MKEECILHSGKKTFDTFAEIVLRASYSGNIEVDGESVFCRFYASEALRTGRDGPQYAYIRIEMDGKFSFNGTYRRKFVKYKATDAWNDSEFAFNLFNTFNGTEYKDIDYLLTMMLLQRDTIKSERLDV